MGSIGEQRSHRETLREQMREAMHRINASTAALRAELEASLAELNSAVTGFSLEGASGKFVVPAGTPAEFEPVFEHMRARTDELRKAYKRLSNSMEAGEKLRKELTQAIALKDVEIAERTAELEQANERLSSQSKRDPLTKIANRREFNAFETRVWNLGAREKMPVAVVLADIDHFKAYNDTLGHQAGDNCLKLVAKALEACANRPLDLVARYGGEEFVAVLGQVDEGIRLEPVLHVGSSRRVQLALERSKRAREAHSEEEPTARRGAKLEESASVELRGRVQLPDLDHDRLSFAAR